MAYFKASVRAAVRQSMKRCKSCTCKHLPVPGYGPTPCRIMSIGERPGANEDREGVPFIGKSGMELNETYLRLAGLQRPDIRVTNSVKCFAAGNRKPSEKEILDCASVHIPDEVDQCQPEIILLLGSTACQLIPGIKLDLDHGFPQRVRNVKIFGGWSGWIVPMYHPASGVHDTRQMIPMLADWERLGKWLNGKWSMPIDQYPDRDYRLISTEDDLMEYLVDSTRAELAVDTERDGRKQWSIQVSHRPGTARMFLVRDKDNPLSAALSEHLKYNTCVLHNATYDLDALDVMGVSVHQWTDTMQLAYHLCDQPQGLKALSWRNLGIRMRTWEDVVKPHSRRVMLDWLHDALQHTEDNCKVVTYQQLKTKLKTITKPSESERALRRILVHSIDKPDYDPWDKWHEWKDKSDQNYKSGDQVESIVGDTPIISIAHVPMSEAVAYGCSDADMTIRIYDWLTAERRLRIRQDWCITEDDCDV